MSKRKRHYSTEPDAVYVSIRCAEPSHADSEWLVASFVWVPRDDENLTGAWHWFESLNYWRDQTPAVRLTGQTRSSLVGDRRVSNAEWKADPFVFDAGSRTRYRFHCETCGLTVERKAPIVYAAFDALAAAGQREVSLRVLKRVLDVVAARRG